MRLCHKIALTSYYLQFKFLMPQRCSGEMILFVIFRNFFARDLKNCGFSTTIIASHYLFSCYQEQLINVIEQQHAEIQSLANERSWLQENNNMQRSQVAKCYGKVVEWQGYKVFTIFLPFHDFSPFPFKKSRRTMEFFFQGGKQKCETNS